MSSLGSAPVFSDDSEFTDETATPAGLALAPESVVVRRNAGLAALVGGLASAVAIAYLARASESGAVFDWAMAAVLGVLGIGYLAALVDARTPLLVADAQGVRIRLGRAWRGLPWGALSRVEHTPRRGLLRDGRLVMVVHNPARLLEELDRGARRQSVLSQKLYGAPFAMPLGLSTRITGAGEDLTVALDALAQGSSRVVELAPTAVELVETPDSPESVVDESAEVTGFRDASLIRSLRSRLSRRSSTSSPFLPLRRLRDRGSDRRLPLGGSDPRPTLAHLINQVGGLFQRGTEATAVDEVEVSETPSPLREPATASRMEVRREIETEDDDAPEGRELRRPGSVSLVEDTQVWSDRVAPIARQGNAVEPLLIDDYAVEPAEDPVIGPDLTAARTRLGLTVDQLAERTRIRPHVIESIEVDDFTPCGGDFYARGHLRTLARILGLDVAPLLTTYDERYSDAPINPRRVFEAELATGANGSIRGTRGGPNWSVLVAAVMALVLAWSVARLVMDSPVDLGGATPVLNGSAGVDNGKGGGVAAPAVPVVLSAAGGGAQVIVREGSGEVVFKGSLSFGETRTLQVSPPVWIRSSDGSLTASIDGDDRGALGATGRGAQEMFTVIP
ncbi:MAG: helix-turn-helix domain-containing protein [Nocardioides sp.]